ncbi:P-loop containing nucleoside triphosphate hydrolase protein, partial [Chytriomyces sp. MP71]
LTPLFRYGYKHTLEMENLYKLDSQLEVKRLADLFEKTWAEDWKEGAPNKRPSKPTVRGVVYKLIGRDFLAIGVYKLISDICFSSAPLLLSAIVSFIKDPSVPLYIGILYALAMFIISMIASICFSFFFQRANMYGMLLRAVMTAVVYRKSLRLSGAARQEFNTGRITNLISSDLVRLDVFMAFFHLSWSYSLITIYVIALLLWQLGLPALAGISILLAMIPLQVYVIRVMVNLRKKNAAMTDKRVRLISETLSSIRIIKFFAWEDSFLQRILEIRNTELKSVMSANLIRSVITASGFALPVLAAAISFMVYFVVSPNFSSTIIFTSLALFNNLRNPIQWTPIMIGTFADAKVALERLQALLECPELTFEPSYDEAAADAVVMESGDFVWDAAARSSFDNESMDVNGRIEHLNLSGINIRIPTGSLVAIVGNVGSGKTSLLSALIGQMQPMNEAAKVIFNGSVGYAPQQPWIMNQSLRENILFGLPYDKERYQAAVLACALQKDLDIISGGDEAEIGERGINLSGGQKQRISIARLLYFNSNIVLMDDPLSAVDAHVGKHIFNECIKKAMAGKTRLLVTHQLHFVPEADIVITMKDGHISEMGTYESLMKAKGDFFDLMSSYGGISVDDNDAAETATIKDVAIKQSKEAKPSIVNNNAGETRLIKAEDRSEGGMHKAVLLTFAIAMGGPIFLTIMLTVLLLAQGARVTNDFWLVLWTNFSIPDLSAKDYLWIYLGLGLGQTALLVAFSVLIAFGGIRAAKSLHEQAITRVAHAPVLFYDTNPLGRVLNRFSRDQDSIDNTLPDGMRLFLITLGSAISTFVLVAYVTTGWLLVALVPLMTLYYYFQGIYRANARELKRLDALTRSVLYAHISESITGVSTIRAYREQYRFIARSDELIDTNNTPYYIQSTGARWLGVRLEFIGNVLILFTAVYGVLARATIDPAMIGLALSYVLQVTQLLSLCIRQFTDAEVQLVSIERMNYYATQVEVEPPGVIEGHRPPSDWPREGRIEFKDLSMRYQEGLPLVLKAVNLTIASHEKVGVVGRTGSGKSSLMLSLFRILEADGGSIIIDGIDIATIGVKDLRSKLSIIPQDPILFSGTIKSNLDPFHEHQDADIWAALEYSGMKNAVSAMPGGLDTTLNSGGENLSVGQRQLVCLARAILRKPKLLVLDECTANVDLETDHFIQKALRETMQQATILTIAHRLNTVMDSDKILVLEEGAVVEFDSPINLLSKQTSIFGSMVDETGDVNAKALKAMIGL